MKVSRPRVPPRFVEKLVFVYLKDDGVGSERTKKKVKTLLAPKNERLQIKAKGKVQEEGITIETGSV